MSSRSIRLLATGLLSLSLTACAGRLVVIEQCPPIPESLTEGCVLPPRSLENNGELARAYLDAIDCLEASELKLRAIRELSSCRAKEAMVRSH